MITLIEAFRLCQIRDTEVFFLRKPGESYWLATAFTGKEVRDKYDMKKTKVKSIRPRFNFGEYEGFEFEVVGSESDGRD